MIDKKWRKIYFALDLHLDGLKMVYIVFSNPLTHTTFKYIVFTFLKYVFGLLQIVHTL